MPLGLKPEDSGRPYPVLCEEAPKAGDHKAELSGRFVGTAAEGVREHVVAPPLRAEIDQALSLVKSAVTKKRSYLRTCTARSAPVKATS
ncbi:MULTISPECIES: hypothetical protein [Streptomyces]|jgi:hypothetical protein|uniref:hypothetical protein n=1 Tax=unclassified Streptomyces TaxID=2593676 RepID=UPI0008EA570C|nr:MULTISPECIES: hypothetical protein [unclassified Streptomyces]MDX2732512.1 hypothetical protein [Streptomyces sp. PA03-2a]SFS61925.1 hypothetical protein SAMN04487982_102403 [Streptomyces sp. ok210]